MKTIVLILLLFVANGLQSQAVYKTPSGKKYHLASCRMVKNVSEKISLAEANTLGLEPCKICKPPDSEGVRLQQTDKSKGTGKTVQCNGFTKSGTRCKHMTSIANGYCYQHQPK